MTYYEYLRDSWGLDYTNNTDDYWNEEEGTILFHYVNYFNEIEPVNDSDFAYFGISEDVLDQFYKSFYTAFGDGIPFFAAVGLNGDTAVLDFMHDFYYACAESSGYFDVASSAPAASVLPAVSAVPEQTCLPSQTTETTESIVVSSESVVTAQSDISFVQLTGVLVFCMAIIAGMFVARVIFGKWG